MITERKQAWGRAYIGICRIYSGTCPRYLAYRENEIEQLNEISQTTGIPVHNIRCNGCDSDEVFPFVWIVVTDSANVPRRRKSRGVFNVNDFPCQ